MTILPSTVVSSAIARSWGVGGVAWLRRRGRPPPVRRALGVLQVLPCRVPHGVLGSTVLNVARGTERPGRRAARSSRPRSLSVNGMAASSAHAELCLRGRPSRRPCGSTTMTTCTQGLSSSSSRASTCWQRGCIGAHGSMSSTAGPEPAVAAQQVVLLLVEVADLRPEPQAAGQDERRGRRAAPPSQARTGSSRGRLPVVVAARGPSGRSPRCGATTMMRSRLSPGMSGVASEGVRQRARSRSSARDRDRRARPTWTMSPRQL